MKAFQRWWASALAILVILFVAIIWNAIADRPPVFGKPVRITAIEYSVMDRSKISAEYDRFDYVGILLLDMFLRPTQRCKEMEPYLNPLSKNFKSGIDWTPLIAQVTFEDENGIKTVVYVRDFGDNPVLVSLDHTKWYIGGMEGHGPGGWKSGAQQISRTLFKYGHMVQKSPETVTP